MKQPNRWIPIDDAKDSMLRMLRRVSRDHGGGEAEAFHRSSASVRVEWDPSTGEARERLGREEGGALRWIDPRQGALGFAAASGDVSRSLRECRSIAAAVPVWPVADCPWNPEAVPVEDLETVVRLPGAGELLDWLRQRTPDAVDSAWVEVAVTSESWLSTAERAQRRVRTRAWAAWTRLSEGPRPLFAAARRWGELDRRDLAAAWRDRALAGRRALPWPERARLVLSPETSAMLAHLLAKTAHRPGVEPGSPVGPGWILTADPGGDPPSLFGSRADDAGFPTRSRVLADGRHVVGHWGGPGGLRRGSFREPPEPRPVDLLLEPPRIAPPRTAVWVTDLEIHPTGDRWAVRLRGRGYPAGAPFRPKWTRIRPSRLLETCLGGIGPAWASHVGVTTPSLVFEPLPSSAE